MKKIMPFIFSIALTCNAAASKDITKKAVDFVINNYNMTYPQGNNIVYIIGEINTNKHIYALEYICRDDSIKRSGLKFELRVIDIEKNTLEIFKNYRADEFDIKSTDRYILKRNNKTIKSGKSKDSIEKKYINNLQIILDYLENNN